jgi:hypothetical protein
MSESLHNGILAIDGYGTGPSNAVGVRMMAAKALEIARRLRSIGRTPRITIRLAGGTDPQVSAYPPDAKVAATADPANDPLLGTSSRASEFAREATQ